MNKKELIDFLNEVIDANEVPLRIRHRALNLKLSISAVNEPETTDEEIEKAQSIFLSSPDGLY